MKRAKKIEMSVDRHYVKTTAATCIAGEMAPVGSIAEVSRYESMNLKHRAKAVDATEDEVANAAKIYRSTTIDRTEDNDLSQALRNSMRDGQA